MYYAPMDWKILAISVPLFFVSYQALAKILPKGASLFLVNAYASLIGAALMLSLHLLTQKDKSLSLTPKMLSYALGIGFLIGLGNFGIMKAYNLGAPQSMFTIIFYVALIIYGTIVGLVLFHEKLQPLQILGALLACFGLFLVVYFKK